MTCADGLRQQAKWIEEALDTATRESQRIGLEDIDIGELIAAAVRIEALEAALRQIHDFPVSFTNVRNIARSVLKMEAGK
jgi:hypothetical protein